MSPWAATTLLGLINWLTVRFTSGEMTLFGDGFVAFVLKTNFGERAFATALRLSESRIGFHVRHGDEATMLICEQME